MQLFPLPIWIRVPVGVLSGVWALLAACLAGVAVWAQVAGGVAQPVGPQIWFLAAFEGMALLAAVFGVLIATGRFATGPAMALLCVAGTWIVTAVLGEPSIGAALLGQQPPGTVFPGVLFGGDLSVLPVLVAQVISGGVLILLAGIAVSLRRPGKSIASLVWAAGSGVPVVIALGVLYTKQGQIASMNAYMLTVVASVGFLVGLVLVSMCVHNVIRAMEHGRAERGR